MSDIRDIRISDLLGQTQDLLVAKRALKKMLEGKSKEHSDRKTLENIEQRIQDLLTTALCVDMLIEDGLVGILSLDSDEFREWSQGIGDYVTGGNKLSFL